MRSQEELLNAYRAFVSIRLGLDVSTCDKTRETAWVHLAHRLMARDEQVQHMHVTA